MDELDLKIVKELQEDCRRSLPSIAKSVGIAVSTLHYRLKRLEKDGIVYRYSADVDSEKLGMDYITVISVWADFGPGYYERIGEELTRVPGVWAVYYCLGEVDFFVLTRAKDRSEFLKILDRMMNIEGIVRTNTHVTAKVLKEDHRLEL